MLSDSKFEINSERREFFASAAEFDAGAEEFDVNFEAAEFGADADSKPAKAEAADEDEAPVQWEDAKDLVLSAYEEFDPKMVGLAAPFFTKGWIDAGVKEGKAPGAFAHPTVTNVHPYVMLNYMGKQRDVMTLAHELGHGVHQVLAADRDDAPLLGVHAHGDHVHRVLAGIEIDPA